MIRNACIGAILAMTAGTAHAAETAAASPDCKLHLVAALEMQTMPDGRPAIPVKIEGHDYRLMVDTGGYLNTLTSRVVRQEGYRPSMSGGQLVGMGNTVLNRYVTVKNFQVENARAADFVFFVNNDNALFVDGTLAPQVLATYDADLDFGHAKFNLISPDHCPGKVVYWTAAGVAQVPITLDSNVHVSVPVTIDGKALTATLDTGAHASYISLSAARRFLDLDTKNPALVSHGNQPVNGMMGPIYSYPFKALSFGGVTVNNPQITIVSDQVWKKSDLLVGIGILRQLHLYIAYKEKKMYITPAMAH